MLSEKYLFQKYPEGVWFLFFKGRLEFVKGNIPGAIEWYTKSWESQDVWPQFHHLCFWELMWANWSVTSSKINFEYNN
jgi:hypothetical protein